MMCAFMAPIPVGAQAPFFPEAPTAPTPGSIGAAMASPSPAAALLAGFVLPPVAPVQFASPSMARQAAGRYDIVPPGPPVTVEDIKKSPLHAAIKIQRWYRSRGRRMRFLIMIRRAVRRR